MKRNRILLGLTGSVASKLYKKLIAELSQIGEVSVVITDKAKPFMHFWDDFSCIDMRVYMDSDEWSWPYGNGGTRQKYQKGDEVLHIKLREDYDLFVIAPCTVNTLAKIANGICDNLLTSIARAWNFKKPFLIAPAANTEMWKHPITPEHLEKIKKWGIKVIPPETNMLACGTFGEGALATISDIVKYCENELKLCFPLYQYHCNGIPVGNHPGAFGVQRKHERHTGVDLYTKPKQEVHAMEPGIIVNIEHFTGPQDNSPWWNDTDCMLIEGKTGVFCYGEIEPNVFLHPGYFVKKGQFIGNVKPVLKDNKKRDDIEGHSTSMLHIELYPHGTKKPSNGFEPHLLDPTPYLIKSSQCLALPLLTNEKSPVDKD